jgi:hypothetical protein
VLDCRDCERNVHYVAGLGIEVGHWAHAEPAPHDAPTVPVADPDTGLEAMG